MSIISTTSLQLSLLLEAPWDSSSDSHSTHRPRISSTDLFKWICLIKSLEISLSRRSESNINELAIDTHEVLVNNLIGVTMGVTPYLHGVHNTQSL